VAIHLFKAFSCSSLLLSAGIAMTTTCHGQSGNPNLLKQVYDAGDYAACVNLAQEKIKERPKDPLAHYYFANSLLKLGRKEEAREEYKRCLLFGRGTSIEAFSREALSRDALKSLSPIPQAGNDSAFQSKLSGATERKRKVLSEAAEREKKLARDLFDQEVKNIEKDNKDLEEVIKAKTQAAFEKYSARENAIELRYRQLSDQLLKSSQAISQMGKSQQGSSRLMPQGSGMYVQNYENMGDESEAVRIPSENPLTATTRKLDESKRKKGK